MTTTLKNSCNKTDRVGASGGDHHELGVERDTGDRGGVVSF